MGLSNMTSTKSKRSGFSLVELVIVVVIIGVIAAIAVPRISRGAKGAGDAALRGSLAGLRNAIDMFAAEHGGAFPIGTDQAELEQRLIEKTDNTGVVNVDPTKNIWGPYLRSGHCPARAASRRAARATAPLVVSPTDRMGPYLRSDIFPARAASRRAARATAPL